MGGSDRLPGTSRMSGRTADTENQEQARGQHGQQTRIRRNKPEVSMNSRHTKEGTSQRSGWAADMINQEMSRGYNL